MITIIINEMIHNKKLAIIIKMTSGRKQRL